MMRRITGIAGSFFCSAVLAVALLLPRPASSAMRNVAAAGCSQLFTGGFGYYHCPLQGQNTTFTTSALQGAFFDYTCANSSTTVTYSLGKTSSTGSVYIDNGTFTCTSAGASIDSWLTASNVKTNASIHDYVAGHMINVGIGYGIEARY